MNNTPYQGDRVRFELKPLQAAKLKQIAAYYGNDNLLHQINLMLDSLWRALELDKKDSGDM